MVLPSMGAPMYMNIIYIYTYINSRCIRLYVSNIRIDVYQTSDAQLRCRVTSCNQTLSMLEHHHLVRWILQASPVGGHQRPAGHRHGKVRIIFCNTQQESLMGRGHVQLKDVECPPLGPQRGIWYPGWWFGTIFIFPYIGNNHPNWLIFFRGVETTNQ